MQSFQLEEYQQDYLNKDRLNFLYDRRWFQLFVPKQFGGMQCNMQEGSRILTEAASIQGGFGWTLNLGAGANYFSGFFDSQTANKLFQDEKTVIAGSGFDSGTYSETENSYILNGRWSRCTGAAHATLFSLNARNTKDDSLLSFVVPRKDVKLLSDEWPIFGLKNTSSFDMVLEDVEVPKNYSFLINNVRNHSEYTVFHIPFEAFARICMASTFIGIVQCLLNNIEEELLPVKSYLRKDYDEIQQNISEAIKRRDKYAEILESKTIEKELSENFLSGIYKDLGEANLSLFDRVQGLFLKGGLIFIEEDNKVHWSYRDVLTAIQHSMVKP